MKLVFFGSDKYVVPVLKELNKNFNVPLVLTTENNESGPVSKFCKENNIEVLPVQKFDNAVKGQLSKINCQVAVLAYFGMILPKDVLKIFPKGILNIHPSLLPKYRGPTPGQSAILAGETKTGVTIIKLDEEIDHGPILAQEEVDILPTDTSDTLYVRLFTIGADMITKIIPQYLEGKAELLEQDHTKATFTNHLTREDGYIDIESLENLSELEIRNLKLEIARKMRAYYPWPGVWFKTILNGSEKIIKLLPNNLMPQQPNAPFLIQVEGKKPMSYKDFANGYKEGREILQRLRIP